LKLGKKKLKKHIEIRLKKEIKKHIEMQKWSMKNVKP